MGRAARSDFDLTRAEIRCLLALRDLESATAGQVLEEARSDANRVLRRLRRRGVVERTPLRHPDYCTCGPRPFLYTLTDRGYALAEHLHYARLTLLELQRGRAGTAQTGDASCHRLN